MKQISSLILVVACLWAGAAFAAAADNISVENATARAVAPGTPVSGAYMTIRNDADADHVLMSAHSDVAQSVEIHNHMQVDGVMKMRRIENIPMPAGSQKVFEPGGFHIMLIGLKQEMNAGDSIQIDLEFEDGSRKTVSFPVE